MYKQRRNQIRITFKREDNTCKVKITLLTKFIN